MPEHRQQVSTQRTAECLYGFKLRFAVCILIISSRFKQEPTYLHSSDAIFRMDDMFECCALAFYNRRSDLYMSNSYLGLYDR